MRVAHISKVTGIAGSEGHLLRLLPGLSHQGVDALMIVLEDPRRRADSFVAAMQSHGIPVTRIPIRHHLDLAVLSKLKSALAAFQPDLVHTHLLHADLYGLIAAEQLNIPAVSSRHNDDKFRSNPLLKRINSYAMFRAARVVAISNALADFVRHVEGIAPHKVVTIRYGLEAPSPAAYSDGRQAARAELGYTTVPVIGFFGRLIEQKGVDILLDAFAIIHPSHPAARLLIVGDGKDRPLLEAQSARLGLNAAVDFAGWADSAQRLMPACDLIAVPSRWEGFGLVTLEAMGWSRPLIASRTSSLPEIILDGETGLLVPPDDAPALAAALERLLSHLDEAAQMGQAGYQRLTEHFSVDQMVCATLDLYQTLTEMDVPG